MEFAKKPFDTAANAVFNKPPLVKNNSFTYLKNTPKVFQGVVATGMLAKYIQDSFK